MRSAEQRQKDAERSRCWREANPEKVMEQRRVRGQNASVAAKRNAVKRTRQWRAAYPDKHRAQWLHRYANSSEEQRERGLAYSNAWKNTHREQARATVRNGRRDKRAFLAEVVGAACVDCGDDRPGAVEYHHPDGKAKGQPPLTHLAWPKLRKEAMTLIAICGACHGVRHHKEGS